MKRNRSKKKLKKNKSIIIKTPKQRNKEVVEKQLDSSKHNWELVSNTQKKGQYLKYKDYQCTKCEAMGIRIQDCNYVVLLPYSVTKEVNCETRTKKRQRK